MEFYSENINIGALSVLIYLLWYFNLRDQMFVDAWLPHTHLWFFPIKMETEEEKMGNKSHILHERHKSWNGATSWHGECEFNENQR